MEHGDLTHEIIGCSYDVLNGLGHGLLKKPYENALVIEFGLRGIACKHQPHCGVVYKGVVVDTKVIDPVTDHEIGQKLNALKITGLKVG